MFLFKLYFSPYYYKTYNGDIVECNYIKYDCNISSYSKKLIVTYECDKLYNCYNRIICKPQNYVLTPKHAYTNYVFMNITLFIEEYQLTIYLRTQQYNFYVCENTINSDFILFYLQNILRIFPLKQDLNIQPYKLIIIDHCFKEHILTENDTLILHKNTFSVIRKNNKDE